MDTQYLSLRSVLPAVGKHDWGVIGKENFPVRILVAGRNSVCAPANLMWMESMVPRTRVVHFPKASHSIHNSKQQDFVRTIRDVYEELDRRKSKTKK